MAKSISKNAFPAADQENRCGCGQLLAILGSQGVEIKCRRCKTLRTISLQELVRFLKKDKEPLSSDPSGQGTAADLSAACSCH
jgi:phage FluMu protein Com